MKPNLRTLLVLASVSCLPAPLLAAHDHGRAATDATPAIAVLVSGPGQKVTGTVRFTPDTAGVRVQVDVSGLPPGAHGFHIHEKGDLSKPDFTSAGAHFNPDGKPHADRTAAERHAGDLGNLEAGADGRATIQFVDPHLQLHGPKSIVGRSVVIHAKADDLKTQPSGDAGGRIAAGVIGYAETAAK